MASNRLPGNGNQLIQLGTNMLAGLTSLGQTLGISQIVPASFQRDLEAFTNSNDTFNAARSARGAASEGVNAAMKDITGWLSVVRGVLTGAFGPRWNAMWAQAGFVNDSTAVPGRVDDRIVLATRLVAFFTANPARQVASMNVTAAEGGALGAAVQATKQALLAADIALTNASGARETAYETLTAEMRLLIAILTRLLSPADARWLAFGLNVPASNATPGQPVNLTAHADGTDAIVVQCEAVPLATRYRWRTRLVGIQTDYQLAASSAAPLGTITAVQPGQTVEIVVQAVNGSQQGVASAPLSFTTPATRVAEPGRTADMETTKPNGHSETVSNGNGKGHTARSRVG